MSKPEIQDVIECVDNQKLNNWAAQICMGWVNHDEARPDTWFSQYQEGCWLAEEWSPASKTDLGKNQCWDLAEEYHCWPRMRNGEYVVFVTHDVPVTDKCPRVAVVKASIICEIIGLGVNSKKDEQS